MNGRVPLLVVGIVISLVGLASFQWVQEIGIFSPDRSIVRVVQRALGRAGDITARQKESELQKILDDAERSGTLDEAALRKAIEGAGEQANTFTDLFENWKRQHPAIPAASPVVPPSQPSSSREPAVSEAATTVSDPFFGSTISIHANGDGWTRIPRGPASPYGLQIDGSTRISPATRDDRTELGFRGVDVEQLLPFGTPSQTKSFLIAPDLRFAALAGRRCDLDGCDLPFALDENPFVVCSQPQGWLEVRMNLSNDAQYWKGHSVTGAFTLRPIRVAADACQHLEAERAFLESTLQVYAATSGGSRWTRIPTVRSQPFQLRVTGTLKLDFETRDQRNFVGPAGIDPQLVEDPPFRPGTSDVRSLDFRVIASGESPSVLEPGTLAAPEFPYAALLGRKCTSNGCDEPFLVGNGLALCPRPDEWVELRTNEPIVSSAWSFFHHAGGSFVVRPSRATASECR